MNIVAAHDRQVLNVSSTGNRLLTLATDDPTLIGDYTPTVRASYNAYADRE
jgi:hypothetical protein